MTDFSLSAPAKLNLFLHVTGQRDDGYHELQTVFHLLDMADTLQFQSANELDVVCPNLDIPADQNLVHKAAIALQQACGTRQGARIHIHKRIPDGGGLGGGSSDAATTLHGLNHLWQLGLTVSELAAIGAGLGADVPVFVHGESAWAEGIGERLTPLDLPDITYLVVHPGCHVPTPKIFQHPDLTRDHATSTIARFLQHPSPLDFGQNDLEIVAKALFPQVQQALVWLDKWGAARMTGSGACVFIAVQTDELGQQILDNLPEHWSGFVAHGVNKSLLINELRNLQAG